MRALVMGITLLLTLSAWGQRVRENIKQQRPGVFVPSNEEEKQESKKSTAKNTTKQSAQSTQPARKK